MKNDGIFSEPFCVSVPLCEATSFGIGTVPCCTSPSGALGLPGITINPAGICFHSSGPHPVWAQVTFTKTCHLSTESKWAR